MSLRVCSKPGCAHLIRQSGLCPEHTREADLARGTRAERGYGREHEQEREYWADVIAVHPVRCSRCDGPIYQGDLWHLDHTDDRHGYRGPSCAKCNLSAAGKRSHE